MSREEIAEKLRVTPSTIDDYLASPQAKEVDRVLARREGELRREVLEDILKPQLQAAGMASLESASAEEAEDVRELLNVAVTLAGAAGRR
jgi:predicted transcriptional regulator